MGFESQGNKKILWLALLQYSLCCNGLERNLQYRRGILVLPMKIIINLEFFNLIINMCIQVSPDLMWGFLIYQLYTMSMYLKFWNFSFFSCKVRIVIVLTVQDAVGCCEIMHVKYLAQCCIHGLSINAGD